MSAALEGLPDLLARIEGATKPNALLDEEVMLAIGAGIDGQYWWWPGEPHERHFGAMPRLTGSVDAALALVERVLPGSEWEITTTGRSPGATILAGGKSAGGAYAKTPPLAILAALIRALLAKASQ